LMVASTNSVRISRDGGNTFQVLQHFDHAWCHCNLSADGKILMLCGNRGPIGICKDGDITNWQVQGYYRWYNGISCSSDGKYIILAAERGVIFTSKDMGISWSPMPL